MLIPIRPRHVKDDDPTDDVDGCMLIAVAVLMLLGIGVLLSVLVSCAPLRRVTAGPPPDPPHQCMTWPSYYDPGCCWKMQNGKCVDGNGKEMR